MNSTSQMCANMLCRMSAPDPEFSGMTVNERLFAAGLLEAWDSAVRAGDRRAAVGVLGRVGLEDQAERIVDTTLADPQKYGFPPSS
jgi:hypothetical protein